MIHTHTDTLLTECVCVHSKPQKHTVGAKRNLSSHLLLISNDMSEAKWEIWISFLRRQSFIHGQKPQMWEDDVSRLDPSRSAPPLELMQTLDAGGGEGMGGGRGVYRWKAGRIHTPTELMLGCFTEKRWG